MQITPTMAENNRLRRRLIRATASQINGLVHLRGGRIGTIVLGLRRRPKPLLLASPNEAAHQQHTTGKSVNRAHRQKRMADATLSISYGRLNRIGSCRLSTWQRIRLIISAAFLHVLFD